MKLFEPMVHWIFRDMDRENVLCLFFYLFGFAVAFTVVMALLLGAKAAEALGVEVIIGYGPLWRTALGLGVCVGVLAVLLKVGRMYGAEYSKAAEEDNHAQAPHC